MIYEEKLKEIFAIIGEGSPQAEATRETVKKLQSEIMKIKEMGPDCTPGTYDSKDRAYDSSVLKITKLIRILNNTAEECGVSRFFDGDFTDSADVIFHAIGLK